jgi:hypothetical protein
MNIMETGKTLFSEYDLAWLGGFWDGEGSFYAALRRSPKSRSGYTMGILASISNTNYSLIDRCFSMIGSGSIRSSCMNGNRKHAWRLILCSRREVMDLIKKISPFLYGKKEVASVCYELAERTLGRNRRYTQNQWNEIIALYNNLRQLNHRGIKPYVNIQPSEIRPSSLVFAEKCRIPKCVEKHFSKGYCREHYKKFVERPKLFLVKNAS